MGFWLFRSKKERATRRVLDTNKDNVSRIKALDYLEDLATTGDPEALGTLLKCFNLTVKPDKQEQSLTPYDDEQEKASLIDRLVEMTGQREQVLKLLRRELGHPPLLSPGRRDGIVWLIELLRDLASASTETDEDADELIRDELIRALGKYDPEETYRDPERKLQLLQGLERHPGRETANAIRPFLEDVDETVRFRALTTLVSVGSAELSEELANVALDDESIRVQARALEVMIELNCCVKGYSRRKEIESKLPDTCTVDKKGVIRSRA